jgi:hypothetical protein
MVSSFLETGFYCVEGIERAIDCEACYCSGLEVGKEVSTALEEESIDESKEHA